MVQVDTAMALHRIDMKRVLYLKAAMEAQSHPDTRAMVRHTHKLVVTEATHTVPAALDSRDTVPVGMGDWGGQPAMIP